MRNITDTFSIANDVGWILNTFSGSDQHRRIADIWSANACIVTLCDRIAEYISNSYFNTDSYCHTCSDSHVNAWADTDGDSCMDAYSNVKPYNNASADCIADPCTVTYSKPLTHTFAYAHTDTDANSNSYGRRSDYLWSL